MPTVTTAGAVRIKLRIVPIFLPDCPVIVLPTVWKCACGSCVEIVAAVTTGSAFIEFFVAACPVSEV